MTVSNFDLYETLGWNYQQKQDGSCVCQDCYGAFPENTQCKKLTSLTNTCDV